VLCCSHREQTIWECKVGLGTVEKITPNWQAHGLHAAGAQSAVFLHTENVRQNADNSAVEDCLEWLLDSHPVPTTGKAWLPFQEDLGGVDAELMETLANMIRDSSDPRPSRRTNIATMAEITKSLPEDMAPFLEGECLTRVAIALLVSREFAQEIWTLLETAAFKWSRHDFEPPEKIKAWICKAISEMYNKKFSADHPRSWTGPEHSS
jgi:hypothetical protein